jgi:hypothetical protein
MFHELSDLRPTSGLDGRFASYETLDTFPHRREALRLLRRCAYIVKHIMRRHNWKCPVLMELPPSSDCYGKCLVSKVHTTDRHGVKSIVRAPEEVMLLLRDPHKPHKFFAMDDLIRTMLHELAHFMHDDHFLGFYRFNITLLQELEHDVGKGRLYRKVDSSEIPEEVADGEEIRRSMMRDLKKNVKDFLGIERED